MLSETVKSLLENDKGLCISAINTLIKIANNILSHPNEAKYRNISLTSETTERVLMSAVGALETLFLMGFEEGSDKLVFPEKSSLDTLTSYRDQLEKLRRENLPNGSSSSSKKKGVTWNKKSSYSDSEVAQFVVSESEFRKELNHQFDQVMIFEKSHLQSAAKAVMPYQSLSEKARSSEKALASDQKDGKKAPFDFQDCILVELLAWFKEDFFSWFDQGYCESCSRPMKFNGHVPANEDEEKFGGHRVESYQCEMCPNSVRFPRYFHPGKLLDTRKGRCMEWASCFALMCRALGLDTRYVWDKTDHVWVEVFSISQNRWIHADPCENKLDCPRMYESGWQKKLSYILAFSKDEVVDVTWRYSANRSDVCCRRNSCRENVLAAILQKLNKEKQAAFPEPKRKFLENRLVKEIAGFFSLPKSSQEGESEGRLSGSLAWRLSRGETMGTGSNEDFVPFTFVVNEEEVAKKQLVVKYSSSKDTYSRGDGESATEVKGWRSCLNSSSNLFRKHEKDWKIVYLARTEGTTEGELKWRFEWPSDRLKPKSILVVFQHKTYEDGCVSWQICNGNSCFNGTSSGVLELSSGLDDGDSYFELTASLSKGKSDVAWQHAQLFRQPESDDHFPFMVKVIFE